MNRTRACPSPSLSALPYVISDPGDIELAARAVANGAVVGHAFANFYVISTRPDAEMVRRVNLIKGRPVDQVGSVFTSRPHVAGLFDWCRLPAGLTRRTVQDLMDALFDLGPFGFRGPAAAHMPAHLTYPDGNIMTTQVIAPGYGCPSNHYIDCSLALLGTTYLYGTSANRSRHLTGAEEEPAHYRAQGLWAEFGHEPDFIMLRHHDEAAARRAYPRHLPMSTTILAFHRLADTGADGRPRLIVERHGSLHLDDLLPVVERLGFGLALGPKAVNRLGLRDYRERGAA